MRSLLLALLMGWTVTALAQPAALPTCLPDEVPGLGGECVPGTGSGPAFEGDARVQAGEVDGMRFNVLLPSGYDRSAKSYPTLYLLHPFGENQDSWLVKSDLLVFTEQQDVIVVLPNAGNTVGFFFDGRDGSCSTETQFMQSVIPYVDAHYRTRPERAQRAIAGASGGATSAMHLAAAHPDVFVAAASMSGPPDLMAIHPLVGQVYLLQAERAALLECGGNPVTGGLFGTPLRDELWVRNANPADLAANLRGMSLFIAAGNGQPCDATDLMEIHRMPTTVITTASARSFTRALDREGIPYTANLDGCGFHSWRYFERDLHEFWPQMLAAFGSAAPPAFDYRRADAEFAVWGWHFAADPARAPEFLEARKVSPTTLTLSGSGLTTVTTAGDYAPGDTVSVSDGESTQALTAGADRRVRFSVDLGTPHTSQQYRTENTVAEQAPDYFTTRTLRIESGERSAFTNPAAQPRSSGGGSCGLELSLLLVFLLGRSLVRKRAQSADLSQLPRVALLLLAAGLLTGCGDASGGGRGPADVQAGRSSRSEIRFEPPREFEATTAGAGSGPGAIASGDFNADGRRDLAIADPAGLGLNVFLGQGDGSFAEPDRISTRVDTYTVTAADINGDGITDLVTGATVGSLITVLTGQGDGRFVKEAPFPLTGVWPQQIEIADFNGDGHADLAVVSHTPGTVSIFTGDGRGGFASSGQLSISLVSLSLCSGDFNGDHVADLAATDAQNGQVHVLLGQGDASFAAAVTYAVGDTPEHVVARDIDGDGATDLLTANEGTGDVAVLRGQGDGRFREVSFYPAGGSATGLAIADFNRDGLLDIAVGNYRNHRITVLAAIAPGVFEIAAEYAVSGAPQPVVAEDFSGDGLADLVAPGTVPVVSGGLSNFASILINASDR